MLVDLLQVMSIAGAYVYLNEASVPSPEPRGRRVPLSCLPSHEAGVVSRATRPESAFVLSPEPRGRRVHAFVVSPVPRGRRVPLSCLPSHEAGETQTLQQLNK